MLDIRTLFEFAKEAGASDIHVTVNAPPVLRIDGALRPLSADRLRPADTEALVREILSEEQLTELRRSGQYDASYGIAGVGRYRINCYLQRGCQAFAARVIPTAVPSLASIAAPDILTDFAERDAGLVLVTGPTGSGKSTTLAAMVDHINTTLSRHIVTLEHPIEYLHTHDQSVINQREVGFDTCGFAAGLRAALRQDPDIILIGEMRDLETIQTGLTAAETGHLVFGTLHTNSAPGTIERLIDVFPAEQQAQIRTQAASVLVGVVAQRLFRRAGGSGRVAAHEILVNTPAIANLIRTHKTHLIEGAMQTGKGVGMRTMADAVAELLGRELIESDDAQPYLNCGNKAA